MHAVHLHQQVELVLRPLPCLIVLDLFLKRLSGLHTCSVFELVHKSQLCKGRGGIRMSRGGIRMSRGGIRMSRGGI
jgi:hypothetical protein